MSKYTLDTPKVIHSAFSISTKSVATENGYEVINISGYASKMYDTSGKMVVDADSEIVNTTKIDLKRLALGRMPLLFQHDQSQIVGNVLKAEQRPDGLYVEAQVVKLPEDPLSTKIYHAVKSGILNSFSIGAIIKNFDVARQDGSEYLVLDESELIELSIVSVPSNHESGFKVMSGINGMKGFAIDKATLKAQNPTLCDDISCVIAKATPAENEDSEVATKGLTLDDTLNEGWFQYQLLRTSLEALSDTIIENWEANKWADLPAAEAKQNVINSCVTFVTEKLNFMNNETEDKQPQIEDNSPEIIAKGKDMTQNVAQKSSETEVSLEVVSGEAEITSTVNDVPSSTPQDESKATIEDAVATPAVEPEVIPAVEPEVTPDRTEDVQEAISLEKIEDFVTNLDLDTVDSEGLEKLLALAEMINLGVEAKVKEELSQLFQPAA